MKFVIEQLYNIDANQVMAMGDNYNDWGMLKYVGLGVAMGNAPQRIRDSVKFSTDTCINNKVLLKQLKDLCFIGKILHQFNSNLYLKI